VKEDLKAMLKREDRDLIIFEGIAEEFGGGNDTGTLHPKAGHMYLLVVLGTTTIKLSQLEDTFCGMCVVSY